MSLLPRSNPNELSAGKADVLVIVALHEEFEYVISALDVTAEAVPSRHPYYMFPLRTYGGEIATVTISFVDKMDSSYASTFTLELLQDIKPQLLVNIGISGLVDDDLHLGDVVVAQSAYNVTYRSKILSKKGRKNKQRSPSFDDLLLGGDPINPYYSFLEIFTHFERTHRVQWLNWRNNSLATLANLVPANDLKALENDSLIALPTKVVAGPIATEPWVGASEQFKVWLKERSNRNFLCMDTESWGVLHGARAYSPELKTLVLRGISDPADERKKKLDNVSKGAFRKWAISNAAQLFALFIEHYWGDNFLPKTTALVPSGPAQLKNELEEQIHKTCVRDFLTPYYNNESRINEHGYDAYGELFAILCGVDDTTGMEFFDHLSRVVVSSPNPNPVLIEGAAGTGKTALLSVLYWFIWKKRQEDSAATTLPLPIFINLHRYNESAKASLTEYENKALGQIEAELSPLKDYIGAFPDLPLVVIVDGFDEFARYKEECFGYVSNLVQSSSHYKIIGSRESAGLVWRSTSRTAPAIVYQLKAIKADDPRLKEVISAFVQIWSATDELVRKDLRDRLERGIQEADIKWIDLFILALVAENKLQDAFGPPLNLSGLLEDYCRRYLRERLTVHNPEDRLLSAATVAFESQVERQTSVSTDVEHFILRDLAQKHSRISDFLTAYHVTHEFLGLAQKKLFETENLRYVYPHRINRLAKELLNRDSKRQIDFAQILDRLLGDKKVQNYAKAQACYLAGRLEDSQAKHIALATLEKYKRRVNLDLSRNPQEETNDRLLLQRTIYISMAFLGDPKSEIEYIDLLFENPRMDLVNRGFHLEYYGDQEYDPTRPLTSEDHLEACPKTFLKLIQNLAENSQENPIYELELLTLCSLAQKRHAVNRLADVDRTKILRLLKVLILKYRIRHGKLQTLVRMLIKHLAIKNFTVSEVFSELYSIKEKKRMGWVKRKLLETGESVADHSFAAYLIGLLFLPQSLPGNTEYKKTDILEMLLIHDLAESITGDILPENSNEQSKRIERETYKEIGLLGTYDQFADTSRIFNLWEEFEERKTINGKIAKEIDKLENLVQLFDYRRTIPQERFEASLPKDKFDEWRHELLGIIETDIGKSILQRLEAMFQIEEPAELS